MTGLSTQRPTCAQIATTHSPWRHFIDFYHGRSAQAAEALAGSWPGAEAFWPGYFATDPLADDLAGSLLTGEMTRPAFEQALGTHEARDESAPALTAFIAQASTLPSAIDLAAAERGARVYRDLPSTVTTGHGVVGAFIFGAIYPNAAIALSLNANIAQATDRRYLRTTKYVADLLGEGGLRWGGEGAKSAARVRLVHGFVRREIARHFAWKTAVYGEPINQVATLLTATVTGTWVIPYAERHGYRFTAREKDDIAMFTALQAHYQGVQAPYLLTDFTELQRFNAWALYYGGLPEADDRPRTMSVLRPLITNGYPFSRSRLGTAAFNAMTMAYSRLMLGDALCDAYEIPRSLPGQLIAALAGIAGRRTAARHAARTEDGAYCQQRKHWWNTHIPMMLERATGSRETHYAQSAKIS